MLSSFDRVASKRRHKKAFNSKPQTHQGTYGTSSQNKKPHERTIHVQYHVREYMRIRLSLERKLASLVVV